MTKKLLSILGLATALGVGAFALDTVGPAAASSTSIAGEEAGPCGSGPKAVLDGLVTNGTITQDQEDAIIHAFRDAWSERGPRGPRARVLQGAVQVAAGTIGVTVDDLKAAYQDGQSIADVATAHGVDPAAVVQAIIDAGTAKIDAAVSAGKLSADRGEALKSHLPDVADRIVHHTKPDC